MKLAILSRNSKLYSTRRLVEAARARGHVVRVLDPLRCYMRIAADGFDMHYKGKPLAGIDAVIPRIQPVRCHPACPRQAARAPVVGGQGHRHAGDGVR